MYLEGGFYQGKYKKEYDLLCGIYIPEEGLSPILEGELLTAISDLEYEWHNNGNCNLIDQLQYFHTAKYRDYLELIRQSFPDEEDKVEEIKQIWRLQELNKLTLEQKKRYTELIDYFIEVIVDAFTLQSFRKLPDWYVEKYKNMK